jgi:hypothetical protein
MKRKYWFLRGLKVAVMIAVFLAVISFVVMTLWNWLVPALFAGPLVSYWQALGLLVLIRLLCGGFRPHHHGHGRGPFGRSWHDSRERWKQMTPEERDEFRSRFRERWGRGCRPGRAAEPKSE